MKRFFIFILLLLVITACIFSLEQSANAKTNWISGEINLIGIGARCEFMLGPKFSMGLTAYISYFMVYNDKGIDAIVLRFYPLGKTFFMGIGLGYHMSGANAGGYYSVVSGLGTTPEIGWKITLGKTGTFFIQPGIKWPIIISFAGETGFGSIIPFFGIGGAF